MTARSIRLRYSGTCAVCSAQLGRGSEAWWDSDTKKAWCAVHGEDRISAVVAEPIVTVAPPPPPPPVAGTDDILGTQGGGSALAKYEQKRVAEEERVRDAWGRFPKLANLIIKVTPESQDTAAWGKGGRAERALSEKLGLVPGVRVLHDRLRPGSKTGNIDHLVVAPTGVWVIDAKAYSGKLELRNKGTFLRPNNQLYVNGRRQDRLVEGVIKQAEAVRCVLATTHPEVPVHAALCFIGTELDWFETPFMHRGALITWPKKLYKSLAKPGALTAAELDSVHLTLSRALRPAVQR